MYKRSMVLHREGVVSYRLCTRQGHLNLRHSTAKMLQYTVLLLVASSVTSGLPRQENSKPADSEPKLVYIIERLQNGLELAQQQQRQQPDKQSQNAQQILSERQRQPEFPYGLNYLEPQLQYPGYNFFQDKQLYPRVQPQIVFYGPGGQGQPILINPGSPPSNFLVPHQPQPGPGPNVILRNTPQRPVFVAGYPKPAHIPPIEKDAEEIPTNPARVPPFPSPAARKPEKLETFNEGKVEYPAKSAGEADFLAAADRNPQLIPRANLKPGQRFFILNGDDLFTNFPLQNIPEPNLKYAQSQPEQVQLPAYQQPQTLQKQNEIDLNTIPIQALLLRNAVTGQITNVQDLNVEEKFPDNLITLNQPTSQDAFFRSNLPLNILSGDENIQPIGQFRFTPPSAPYFSFDGEDIENDSIVVDAKVEDDGSSSGADADSEPIRNPQKVPEPSTAQAAPGAIALAGPGGVAGAAPRGTALVGRGGLAVASPQATAVAGPSKPEDKDKKPTRKSK